MSYSNKHFLCTCVIVAVILIAPVYNAPKRNRSSGSTKYDQKQSGDYNIQVHLKDFQIVAVLGDDALGSYGDYDYYDYADLTIKPIVPATTSVPLEVSNSTENEPETPEGTSQKPNEEEGLLIENSAATPSNGSSTKVPVSSTEAPATVTTTRKPSKPSFSGIVTIKVEVINTTEPIPTTKLPINSTKLPEKTTRNENSDEGGVKKAVSIVPVEHPEEHEQQQHLQVPLGEIMHYRKCSEGYTRDKRGRCRKILRRTPQLPFGISRFASNLAARFRKAALPEQQDSLSKDN